jgi:hypothetical protein
MSFSLERRFQQLVYSAANAAKNLSGFLAASQTCFLDAKIPNPIACPQLLQQAVRDSQCNDADHTSVRIWDAILGTSSI